MSPARVMVVICFVLLLSTDCKKKMREIKFDLGQNIVETARSSGVTKYDATNYAGWISYSVQWLPEGVGGRYTRPGYEITWSPLYSFTLNADRNRTPNDLVVGADLTLSNKVFYSHEAAQDFVEQTIAQFQRGKWKRHIDDGYPAVTGRSSLLNEAGQLTDDCSPDPEYKFTREEWLHYADRPSVGFLPRWEWLGDGVFVQLEVEVMQYPDYPGDVRPKYHMSLEFQLDAQRRQSLEELHAQQKKEHENKSWAAEADAREAAGKVEIAERVKRLEANALKRGDRVVER